MGKYVITFEDEPGIATNREKYYKCCEFPWWVATKTLLGKLVPYTEPDTEQVRKEAYKKGFEDGKHFCPVPEVCHDNAYQKGLSDAWEVARKIIFTSKEGGIEADIVEEIFNVSFYSDVLKDYSASEAIEKIREYEQKKEEIQIGDEVEGDEDKQRGVVIDSRFENSQVAVLTGNSKVYSWWSKCAIHKTGRHFPEIAEVLRKIKESNNVTD